MTSGARLLGSAVAVAIAGVAVVACGAGEQVVVVGDIEEPQVTAPVDVSSTIEAATSTTGRPLETIRLRPDQPLHDACLDPPGGEGAAESDNLTVEPELVSAGQELTFTWDVEGRGSGDFTTHDEMIVACWKGSEWTPVWYAFGTFTDPSTVVLTPETVDRWAFSADGWGSFVGTVHIPIEARPGTYSLISDIVFREGADDRWTAVEAQTTFVVAG